MNNTRESKRIVLRMSGAAKLVYIPTIVICLLFGILGVIILKNALIEQSVTDMGNAALVIVFFGGGGLLALRYLIKTAGYLEVREDGLFVDSYLSTGFIPWINVAEIGTYRAVGTRYLGIKINDIESYIASSAPKNFTRFRDQARTLGMLRFMIGVLPGSVVNIIISVFGYTKFPDALTAADILRWNGENFGYHICIQSFWVPNLNNTIALICSRRQSYLQGD